MIKKAQELFECTQTSTDSHVLLHENGIPNLGSHWGLWAPSFFSHLFQLAPQPCIAQSGEGIAKDYYCQSLDYPLELFHHLEAASRTPKPVASFSQRESRKI